MSEDYLRRNADLVVGKASVIENRLEDDVDLERLIDCSKEFKELGRTKSIPVLEIDKEFNEAEILKRLKEILL